MVSFELGKEIERDVFRLVTSVGQRKNSEFPWGIEPPMLYHWDSSLSELYYEVHVTRVLHTARISNVDSVIFVNRIREMARFELGKEIENGFIVCISDNIQITFVIDKYHELYRDWVWHGKNVRKKKIEWISNSPGLKILHVQSHLGQPLV